MIINEMAGSGGDLMPYMFKRRKIGLLVGKRTWGGLVHTADTPTFVDGGSMIAPRGGFFDRDGKWAVENEGVTPDVDVENWPKDVIAGKDPQLERAVTEANKPDKMKINPSLMFSGGCGDAFRRYASLFGGEIVYMVTYAESPLAKEVPPDWRDKVWFARLRVGGLDVTGGDMLPRDYETPRGFSMVLGVANLDEADRVFAGLAEGGEVLMPLQATHWSPRYGLVRDPFGIRWEINCDGKPAA